MDAMKTISYCQDSSFLIPEVQRWEGTHPGSHSKVSVPEPGLILSLTVLLLQ